MSTKELNRGQVQWAPFLADFNFELEHRPERKMYWLMHYQGVSKMNST